MLAHYRPDTMDKAIYDSVQHGEYGAVPKFSADSTVVDIGAHIGSFTLLALSRGAKRVLAFEPDVENFKLLQANCAPYGDRVTAVQAAVVRSDEPVESVMYSPCIDPRNTGGGGVMGHTDREYAVPAVSLDSVLRDAAAVAYVKLDCEGSEYPILLTSKELRRVHELAGEFHGSQTCTIQKLCAHLQSLGMRTHWHYTQAPYGKFAARWL